MGSPQQFTCTGSFYTERNESIPELTIAYHTWGQLNEQRDNVIWICHALTASSDAESWWPGMIGEGCVFDPSRHFIVCANILASCYGTTGPLSIRPQTGQPWYHAFPFVTIRDMARAHVLLADHLNIAQISLLVGGSMGGYQALEWSLLQPARIEKLFLIATAAMETPWRIAIHTAQRLAIEGDASWRQNHPEAGLAGLKAARAIAMLTYRSYESFVYGQAEPDKDRMSDFRVSGYIHHQANKLARRFNAFSYYVLSQAMDTHNLARGRQSDLTTLLSSIRQPAQLIAIRSDLLCPLSEMQFLEKHLPGARLDIIDSPFGHDGFLTEHAAISAILRPFL